MDETLHDGSVIHAFVRRIAVNPVSGVMACAVVVLSLLDGGDRPEVTFAHIAKALSADYFNLYYVNVATEQFIEYRPDSTRGDLLVEKRGEHFFETARALAPKEVFEEDRENFLKAFTRENVLGAVEELGTFTLNYRLMMDGSPLYVNMKATGIRTGGEHIVIGVSNVDAQMRRQEELERIKEEEITYTRIAALAGNYIAVYTVDPETGRYAQYSATGDYEGLGLVQEGDDFFGTAREQAASVLHQEDLPLFRSVMEKETVLREIGLNGAFSLNYRLLLRGTPRYVSLKIVMVQEKDGPKLIVGISDIDAQVKREQEYVNKLSAARDQANIDALTGVRNKFAYDRMAQRLDRQIRDGVAPAFALVMFDINGLKTVNDTLGHQAGDRFLQTACGIICDIFCHSPVYRVGGDEFVVVAQNRDYEALDQLVDKLAEHNEKCREDHGIVIACGAARFQGDPNVAEVFRRADVNMYENKKALKDQ